MIHEMAPRSARVIVEDERHLRAREQGELELTMFVEGVTKVSDNSR